MLRRCAYWSCLLGRPESKNEKYQDVRIHRKNVFNGEALRRLMVSVSREEEITHGA